MVKEERKNDTIFLIKYLNKLVDSDFDHRLMDYGLTSQQGRILFFVHRKNCKEGIEIHQNDIEQEFHLSKSTVSGLVKRMEKKGIISVEKQHPYAIIKPAQAGLDIIMHLRDRRKEAIDKLLKDLDENKQKELIELLNKLIENMEGDGD